jgi:multiple sugar transport system substrate-binding protein
MRYRGLTWDHPRGYRALMAAAERLDEARDDVSITWDIHSLEGFEAHPIEDLCERYDLVVLDHPHVGEAVAAGCLKPLESLLASSEMAALERDTIGPCFSSYQLDGLHWALPLDAASQVLGLRADLHEGAPPVTWDEVIASSERESTALSLAGPHAALGFQSIAAAFAAAVEDPDPDQFVTQQAGLAALDVLATLAARSPRGLRNANPIGILTHMATADDVALCPLIYGYVNYAVAGPSGTRPAAHAITFANAPRATPNGRPGSTLGGTGIGISTRCKVTPALLDHLRWLLSEEAQTHFIPAHEGQPSRRSAWMDDDVNSRWGNFYRNTAETLERAHVRPRHDHAIAFQTSAAALIREALEQKRAPRAVLADLQASFARSRQAHVPPRRNESQS